jgi:glycosyltransferase involved in cell wall biosynthesis
MRFKIIMCGRNHAEWAEEALASVAMQIDPAFDVCMVDDASTDGGSLLNVLKDFEQRFGWEYIQRPARAYALANQVLAWNHLEPEAEDVIVWVDLDDHLARPDALSIVRGYYERGALLTYGSYRPFPEDHPNAASCRPAKAYDPMIRDSRGYRGTISWFNHLRTCSWKVLSQIPDTELRRKDGRYFLANTDRAVMWPALEIAGGRAVYVSEVLYEYRCDSPDAIWRSMNEILVAEDYELRTRPKREVLGGV